MSSGFKMYRVLCSTPPGMEGELALFDTNHASFAEKVAMPAGILFPTATFRSGFDLKVHRRAAENNVRMVDFFLQVFGNELPEGFASLVNLALECVANPAMPLRRATVLFPDSATEDLKKFRETLAADPRCEVRDYRDEKDLAAQFRAVQQGWFDLVASVP